MSTICYIVNAFQGCTYRCYYVSALGMLVPANTSEMICFILQNLSVELNFFECKFTPIKGPLSFSVFVTKDTLRILRM